MSIYIHIPFCNNICSYCDFCKFYYNKEYVDNYLIALEKEIKANYKNELVNTIYIGGGTPSSLNNEQLDKLLNLTNYFNKIKNLEFTIEVNPDIDLEKILILKKYGINRVSIGIETVNEKHLKTLNRFHTKEQIIKLINTLKENRINNINVDLMYALPNQTIEELESDIDFLISLDIPHISTYSLIIEPHTKLYIDNAENIDEELDYEMYKLILKKLNKYNHYEISNFAKKGFESKHNLVYWNNLEYYGFGIGASGYIDSIRYDNTRSYKNYISGNYVYEKHLLEKGEKIENEFILGFRKLEGINIINFKTKYDIDIFSIDIVNKLLEENKLLLQDNYLKINPKCIYISNSILVEFLDIDINIL